MFFGSSEATGQLASFVHRVTCDGDAKLVWFLPNPRTYLYSPGELGQRIDLTVVKTESDGVLYDVRPRPGTPTVGCTQASGR